MLLRRLIYVSRAMDELSAEALDGLMERARQKNTRLEVTGGLCLHQGTFLQYLEGEATVVDTLFETICADPHHHGLKLLEKRDIPKRWFPGWSMAMLEWDNYSIMVFKSFSPGQQLDLYATDPSTAAPLYRALCTSAAWKTH